MAQPSVAPKADVEQKDAAYKTWFREQVEIGLREADDPATAWVSHEEVMAELDELRATWKSEAAKERTVA